MLLLKAPWLGVNMGALLLKVLGAAWAPGVHGLTAVFIAGALVGLKAGAVAFILIFWSKSESLGGKKICPF